MVAGIDNTRKNGMEKCGITTHSDHFLVETVGCKLSETLGKVNTGAHAVAGLVSPEAGCLTGHNITADIADNDSRIFFKF